MNTHFIYKKINMAITLQQLESLGFLPSKRSSLYNKKYDTLVFPINNSDFLYLGYNEYSKTVSNKIIWKSFKDIETGERITYPVIHLRDTTFGNVKDYINRTERMELFKEETQSQLNIYSPVVEQIVEITNIPNG